jgi:hypothetical protein
MTMQDTRLEPIWSHLDADSFSGLMGERRLPAAVRIVKGEAVAPADSPLLGVADTILARARKQDGLRLTASGFLGLDEVKAIFETVPWDETEKDMIRAVCRVIHERDFTALRFARMALQEAGLLRRRKGRLLPRKGSPDASSLFPEIVSSTFWGVDLAGLDGVPLSHWPQGHVGLTLWAISACGLQWTAQRDLMALTTFPCRTLDRVDGETMMSAFQLRVLRPLVWLGLMEMEHPWNFSARGEPRVRKSSHYDRVFQFAVGMRDPETGPLH